MVKVPQSKPDTDDDTVDVPVNVSASSMLAEIETLVAKGDEAISQHVGDLIAKAKEVASGPATTMLVLEQAYGEDLSAEFPRPVKDAKAEHGVNGPHEFFDASKQDKDGNFKTRKCNFYTEFWADTSAGRAQDFVINQLSHFGKNGSPTKAEKLYQDMSANKRANLLRDTTSAKSRGRSMIRKAMQVWYAMHDLAAYSDRVELVWSEDTDNADELAKTQYPLDLIDKKRVRNFKPMSIGDIAKLDVAAAVLDAGEKGSLYDALLRQLSRGKAKTTTGTGIANVDQFFDSLRDGNVYLDIGSQEGKDHWAVVRTNLARKGSDDLVQILGDYRGNLNAIWTAELEKRYAKIQAKQMEQTDEERAA